MQPVCDIANGCGDQKSSGSRDAPADSDSRRTLAPPETSFSSIVKQKVNTLAADGSNPLPRGDDTICRQYTARRRRSPASPYRKKTTPTPCGAPLSRTLLRRPGTLMARQRPPRARHRQAT